jgi:hypothetical protein
LILHTLCMLLNMEVCLLCTYLRLHSLSLFRSK